MATLAGMSFAPAASAAPRLPERPRHEITFDKYSLLLNGRRQFVWSADGIGVPIFHNDKGRNGIWVRGTGPASPSTSPAGTTRRWA